MLNTFTNSDINAITISNTNSNTNSISINITISNTPLEYY